MATVIGCAFTKGALFWGVMEIASLLWILPALILPLAKSFLQRRTAMKAA